MDLGFLPESIRYFAISGRAAIRGPKGSENNPLPLSATNLPTTIQYNTEPIRLTFDAGKAFWGDTYSHAVEVWVAYRYWQNIYGYNHATSTICNDTPGVSNGSCTISSVYAGTTVKF
jgi:hypothetical protein